MIIIFTNIEDGKSRDFLQVLALKIFKEVEKYLSLPDNLKIEFKKKEDKSLDDLGGIGGFCKSADKVIISVSSTYNFKDNLPIERTLSHELYHASKAFEGINVSEGSIEDFLINEGEADHFSQKITGKVPIWAHSLKESEIQKYWEKISLILSKEVDDKLYEDWFIKGTKEIPKWAGYSLGYWLVSQKDNRGHKICR